MPRMVGRIKNRGPKKGAKNAKNAKNREKWRFWHFRGAICKVSRRLAYFLQNKA